MESQPTIVTITEEPQPSIVEKTKPEVSQEPAAEKPSMASLLKGLEGIGRELPSGDPNVAEASKLLMPDFAKLFSETLFKNLDFSSSSSDSSPAKEKEEADSRKPAEEKPAFNVTDIMNLVRLYIPMLTSLLSRDSDIPERGDRCGGPSFRNRNSKDASLLVQIIIGKFSFIVTRAGEDKYTLAFKKETIFQKKVVSAKGLYKLLKTVTGVLDKNVHFGLLSNGVTLENKIIEPMDISKKVLKTYIRYFLCLI